MTASSSSKMLRKFWISLTAARGGIRRSIYSIYSLGRISLMSINLRSICAVDDHRKMLLTCAFRVVCRLAFSAGIGLASFIISLLIQSITSVRWSIIVHTNKLNPWLPHPTKPIPSLVAIDLLTAQLSPHIATTLSNDFLNTLNTNPKNSMWESALWLISFSNCENASKCLHASLDFSQTKVLYRQT